jgi:pimeloyl-ACP methyl ester carboxylesterase
MPIPKPARTQRIPTRLREHTINIVAHDWGDERHSHVVVCAHGLSRNGRDFDVFAYAMSEHARVLSFDVPGRGKSDWLPEVSDYVIPTYVDLLAQALGALDVHRFDWVGTSMGGLIGMGIALADPLSAGKLVVNDVGPVIERAALERIGTYMRMKVPVFDSFDALNAAAQFALAPFGPLTVEQKLHLVRTSSAQGEDGKWRFNSDPKISDAFLAALAAPEVDLWPMWTTIKGPILILRGEHSDLLSSATATKMLETNTDATLHTVADTGHAPMLMDAATIARIAAFLKP